MSENEKSKAVCELNVSASDDEIKLYNWKYNCYLNAPPLTGTAIIWKLAYGYEVRILNNLMDGLFAFDYYKELVNGSPLDTISDIIEKNAEAVIREKDFWHHDPSWHPSRYNEKPSEPIKKQNAPNTEAKDLKCGDKCIIYDGYALPHKITIENIDHSTGNFTDGDEVIMFSPFDFMGNGFE